jgi:hypothetical protein
LVVLTYVSIVIVATAATILGVRTDQPSLLSAQKPWLNSKTPVDPACEHKLDLRLVSAFRQEGKVLCEAEANIDFLAPRSTEVVLFVNGKEVASETPSALIGTFSRVKLDPGINIIAIYVRDDLDRYTRKWLSNSDRNYAIVSWRLLYGEWPSLHNRDVATVEVLSERQETIETWTEVGADWKYSLVMGGVGSKVKGPKYPNNDQRFREDGFAVVALAQPAITSTNLETSFRTVSVARQSDSSILVAGRFCLPWRHFLIGQAKDARTGAAALEVFERLSGTRISRLADAPPVHWRTEGEASPCTVIETQFAAKSLAFRRGQSTFLEAPGDKLTVVDFGHDSWRGGSKPEASANQLTWTGPVDDDLAIDLGTSVPDDEPDESQGTISRADATGRRPPPKDMGEAVSTLPNGLPRAIVLAAEIGAPLVVVCIIWFAMAQAGSAGGRRLGSRRIGLRVLLYLTALPVLQPIVLGLATGAIKLLQILSFGLDISGSEDFGSRLYMPVAIAAAMLIPSIIKAELTIRREKPAVLARTLSAATCIFAIVLGIFIVLIQRTAWTEENNGLTGRLRVILAGEPDVWLTASVAWVCLAPIGLAAGVYWLGRTLSRRVMLTGLALIGGIVLFALQLIPTLAEAGRVKLARNARGLGDDVSLPDLDWTAALAPGLIVLIAGFVYLRALRPLLLLALPRRLRSRVPGLRVLFAIAAALSWPGLTRLVAHPEGANAQAVMLGMVFTGLCAAIALVAPISCIVEASERRRGRQYWSAPSSALLLAGFFAAYVSLLGTSALAAAIIGLTGWFVFKRWILGKSGPYSRSPRETPLIISQKILENRVWNRLLDARVKGFHDRFAKGEITAVQVRSEEADVRRERLRVEETLAVPIAVAKRQLLQSGPERTAFRNGMVGALGGIVAAVVMQVLASVRVVASSDGPTAYSVFLMALSSMPKLNIINLPATDPGVSILPSLALIVNVSGIWLITGFVFGFCFHRIRGSDGFSKAIVFGAGLSLLYILQISIAPELGRSVGPLTALVPILLFLLILGTFIFDARTLARHGVSIDRLPAIYGLSASVGYASIAGLIAGLQTTFQAINSLFKH